MLISFLIYIYISPPFPYPTIYFHVCIHSPSLPSPRLPYPILPSLSLLSLPLPYTTIASLLSTPHPSAPLFFPLLPNTLIYPTLPSHPLPSAALSYPNLLYHTLSPTYPPLSYHHLGNPTLPALPSTPLPYAFLPSHLIYSLSPSTLSSSAPHPTPPLP